MGSCFKGPENALVRFNSNGRLQPLELGTVRSSCGIIGIAMDPKTPQMHWTEAPSPGVLFAGIYCAVHIRTVAGSCPLVKQGEKTPCEEVV